MEEDEHFLDRDELILEAALDQLQKSLLKILVCMDTGLPLL